MRHDLREHAVKLSPGKWKGLQAVSDARGVIAALALDQRSALRKLIAEAKGPEANAVPTAMLEQFKEAVSRILTPHASAILLDPEYGLPASRQRAKNVGLLLAYEKTGYDKSIPGRLPHLLDHYSVRRLVDAGADCIKILLYYSPLSSPETNDLKQAWVERIGAECAAADVPFFLELVSYADGMDEKGKDFAGIKAQVVTRSVEEFSKTQFGVDVLKVGVPVNISFVEGMVSGSHDILYSREEAKAHFRRASDAAGKPFIYLSEGVGNELFDKALHLAAEAGSKFCGVLCGRATWKDGVPIFVKEGLAGLESWLKTQGVANIRNVNAQLSAAKPWFASYGANSDEDLIVQER
jgi:tagatose 1,6-diphosphate aldolase